MNKKLDKQITRSASEIDEKLLEQLLALNVALHSLTSLVSSETQLTFSELVASEHLRLYGPLTAKEVASRVGMGSSGTTTLLDRLEKRGFIKRLPHPTDRRSIMIHYLEQKGKTSTRFTVLQELFETRIRELKPAQKEAMTLFFKDLSEDIARVLQES